MVLLVAKSGVVGPCRGIFALGGRAPFWPSSAAGTRPSRGEVQKGVQYTCGFLYPLLRLPLIFRWLLSAASQLKTRAAIKTALSSGALRRRLGLASRSISAHISARQRVPVGWIGNRLCDLSGLLPWGATISSGCVKRYVIGLSVRKWARLHLHSQLCALHPFYCSFSARFSGFRKV